MALLLFLHGWGESGCALEFLKCHGVPNYLDTSDGLPFVVLAPQAPEGVEWQELTRELMDFLNGLFSEYDADPHPDLPHKASAPAAKGPGYLPPITQTFSLLWTKWARQPAGHCLAPAHTGRRSRPVAHHHGPP